MSAVATADVTTPEPGLHPDVPAEEYHAWPAASQTLLKVMRDRSPAHAREQMMNPKPPTPAMMLGTAVHTAVLQPDVFAREFMQIPDINRRTKAGREKWAQLVNYVGEEYLLRPDDYDLCLRIRDAVHAHPIASRLIVGDTEQSVVWRDQHTGVLCKGRFDVLNTRVGALVDLKTTRDASARSFTRDIYNFGYYLQAAHYLAGAYAHGVELRYSTIIAVEREAPFCVAVYHIRDEAVAAGEGELHELLKRWAECETSGHWPGYPEQATEISLPPWAWYEIKEDD